MLEGAFWQPLTHVAAGQVGIWPVSTGDGQYTCATEASSQGRGLVHAHVALSASCRPDKSSAAQFCRVTLQQCTQHAILAISHCVSRVFHGVPCLPAADGAAGPGHRDGDSLDAVPGLCNAAARRTPGSAGSAPERPHSLPATTCGWYLQVQPHRSTSACWCRLGRQCLRSCRVAVVKIRNCVAQMA